MGGWVVGGSFRRAEPVVSKSARIRPLDTLGEIKLSAKSQVPSTATWKSDGNLNFSMQLMIWDQVLMCQYFFRNRAFVTRF